jgi:cytochrome c oxidase subunit III
MASEAHLPAVHQVHSGHDHGHDAHAHPAGLQHQFDNLDQQRESMSLGMWLFLATEVMMFGGLFLAYTFYRWRFSPAFHEGSSHLMIIWGTANTFVLLFSSWTMAKGVHAATVGNRRALVFWLSVTWILGAAFIGVKAVEWGTDWVEGLIPGLNWTFYQNPHHAERLHALAEQGLGHQHVMMYFVVYFCMTGLHAIHMIIGLGLVGYFIYLANKGHFTTNGNDQPVEILGLYWHIVDIVWIFLFPLLYLIAGFNPFGGGH